MNMKFERRDMSGAMFKNDKRGNPKAPDYTGNAIIGNTEYRISAWVKDGKNGKFMSVAFRVKADEVPMSQKLRRDEPIDDEIPF